MKKIVLGVSALALGLAMAMTTPALAQQHHDGQSGGSWHGGGAGWHGSSGWHGSAGWHGGARGGFVPMHHFAGHDWAHFSVGDRAAWRGGRWWHGPWHGRRGWWWFAGGAWYFYDTPVYPYPGYVSDYYVDQDSYDNSDYAGGAPYSWYYCQNPPGYYPYIQNCKAQWQAVPAGAPSGYTSEQNDQGPPPGYNDGQDDQDGPPPGYQNGPGPNGPNGPPPSGH
jgi:hypothetical protein